MNNSFVLPPHKLSLNVVNGKYVYPNAYYVLSKK